MWGTRFGTGDGLTTFNVPDVRGLLPVFFGGGIGLGMGATGGASQVALGKGNIPSMNHVHGTNAEGNSSYQTIYTTPVGGQQYGIPYASGPALNVTFYPAHVTQTTDPGGSSSPFSIVPPVIGVVPLLKL
jgi:microcystin-dependent protein